MGEMAHCADEECYKMLLFVSGDTPVAEKNRQDVERFCREFLAGRCELKVVDVLRETPTAKLHRVFATPTLVVSGPVQVRIMGDFGDQAALMALMNRGKRRG